MAPEGRSVAATSLGMVLASLLLFVRSVLAVLAGIGLVKQ